MILLAACVMVIIATAAAAFYICWFLRAGRTTFTLTATATSGYQRGDVISINRYQLPGRPNPLPTAMTVRRLPSKDIHADPLHYRHNAPPPEPPPAPKPPPPRRDYPDRFPLACRDAWCCQQHVDPIGRFPIGYCSDLCIRRPENWPAERERRRTARTSE